MKRLTTLLMIMGAIALSSPRLSADEGMWLLPYLKQQNIQRMQAMGLTLSAEEIYSPGQGSVVDAVVHFDGGCTGVMVSPLGLLFTNHHCGFDQIRQHSTVEHNYLRDGFKATLLKDELPNPGLSVTFTEEIVDLSAYVADYLKRHNTTDPMVYLSRKYLRYIAEEWYKAHRGPLKSYIELDLAPYYEGNKYFLNISKAYSDVRLVAAPPNSVGAYGEDTDNWVWPRHSGDVSIFRVYTAPDGSPAAYSPHNVPLRPRHYLKVNAGGLQENDFVMIVGFPGRTNHFYTAAEVAERRDIDNSVRIQMRGIRQKSMLEEMRRDEAVNIQYGSKYQRSSNAHKNAMGSNWAINKLDLEGVKRHQADRLVAYAQQAGKPEYIEALKGIEAMVAQRAPFRYAMWNIDEGLLRAVETVQTPLLSEQEFATLKADKAKRQEYIDKKVRAHFDKDYNPAVDRKVTREMLTAYLAAARPGMVPAVLQGVTVEAFVDRLFDTSIYMDMGKLDRAIARGSYAAYAADPVVRLASEVKALYAENKQKAEEFDRNFARLREIYVRGVMEMEGEMNVWPDANSTLRYTFGRLKGYSPRDNVYYGFQTTMEGVMEKEDATNPEYFLQPRVKEIYTTKDFGDYAMADGRMPVNICATTHTTGGNSGSPVIDRHGNLVGLNFDRNWEGVGGDINYLPDYQRSIICDVRYILLMLDKYLGAERIIQELDIAK